MPVYKSSPERTRRLLGSGVIVARPPRQGERNLTRPKRREAIAKIKYRRCWGAFTNPGASGRTAGDLFGAWNRVPLRKCV